MLVSELALPVAAAPLVPRSFTSIFTFCRTFDTHSLSSAAGQKHTHVRYTVHVNEWSKFKLTYWQWWKVTENIYLSTVFQYNLDENIVLFT